MSTASLQATRADALEEGCLFLANNLIKLCGLDVPQVTSLNSIRSGFFTQLFERIFGFSVPDLISCPSAIEDEVHNTQAVIDTLSLDILSISLSHITGEDIVAGNLNSIHDLLEVFQGYLLHCDTSASKSNLVDNLKNARVEDDEHWLKTADLEEKIVHSTAPDSEETNLFICGLCGYCRKSWPQKQFVNEVELVKFGSVSSCPICANEGARNGSPLLGGPTRSQKKSAISLTSSGEIKLDEAKESPLQDKELPNGLAVPLSTNILDSASEIVHTGLRDYYGEKVGLNQQGTHQEPWIHASFSEQIEEGHSKSSSSVSPKLATVVFKSDAKINSHGLPDNGSYPGQQETVTDGENAHYIGQKISSEEEAPILEGRTLPEQQERATQTSKVYRPAKKEIPVMSGVQTKDRKQRKHDQAQIFPYTKQDEVPELYGKNLEAKVRNFLEEKTHHRQQSAQIKRVYLQSLKKPYRKPISPLCRKSFLLPYYLRRRAPRTSQKRLLDMSTNSQSDLPSPQEDIAFLKEIREEFPNVHLSPATVNRMTQRYEKHLFKMQRRLRDTLMSKSRTQIQAEEAVKRQKILSDILKKEMLHNQHVADATEHKTLERKVKARHRDVRIESAKTKQYYDEFYEGMKKKLQKTNYSEEQLVKNMFEERLNLEKEQIHQLRQQLREKQQKDGEQYKIYLDALENFYQTQFALLAESLAVEKHDMEQRTKAQKRVLNSMKREFQSRMKEEIRQMQEQITQAHEDIHFRELDAERYSERLRDEFSAHPLHKI